MRLRIAIIGAGPTGLYTLAGLVRCDEPLEIVLYDKGPLPGAGTPYSREGANRLMLANIASIEIPSVSTTYLEWMRTCPPGLLESFGITEDMLDDRLFTPRLLLGHYLHDQLLDQISLGQRKGHEIELRHSVEVTDIQEQDGRFRVVTEQGPDRAAYDHVVIATGHDFPEGDAARGYFPNPWSGLLETSIPATSVGIMGTSLSAIDAALAVVCQHGEFKRGLSKGELVFKRDEPDLTVTLMSRNGILPEADFYCPIPYRPLQVMTDERLAEALSATPELDVVFSLFREELRTADPAYAARIGLGNLDADSFPGAYFADRAKADPFRWARHNLDEVERNRREKITVEWRYAILRMHEKIEPLVADFSEQDRERFDKGLKRVFIDNYAAVPPESIRRLLALRDAGILKMLHLGEDYDLRVEDMETTIVTEDGEFRFPIFIDARGQKPLTAENIRFPHLRQALLTDGQDVPALDRNFALLSPASHAGRVHFAAIPYLMHDRPFSQGIVASAEIGSAIADAILASSAEPEAGADGRLCA